MILGTVASSIAKGPIPIWQSGLIMNGTFTINVRGVGEVDWGDGSPRDVYNNTAANVTLTHVYAAFNGTIKFYGTLTRIDNRTTGSDLYHDIASIPAGVLLYENQGSNTAYGDLANLDRGITSFSAQGFNTITGDIADVPSNLTLLTLRGNNTCYGDVGAIPGNKLVWLSITTTGILTGSLSAVHTTLTYTELYGAGCRVSDYTGGRTWANNQRTIEVVPAVGYGLTSAEVDAVLIDAAAAGGTWASNKEVRLTGSCAPRTSASDAAVATLQSKGVTVQTNP